MYQTNLTGKQTGENENIQIYFTILLKERNLLTNVASSLFVVNQLSGKLTFRHSSGQRHSSQQHRVPYKGRKVLVVCASNFARRLTCRNFTHFTLIGNASLGCNRKALLNNK